MSKNLTLENEFLKVGIRQKGAELFSFQDKRDGLEHMWKADPAFWPRHAPILFPTVGESKDGLIQVDDQSYEMGRHGFARHELFSVIGQGYSHVELELRSDPSTLRQYPFDFRFRTTYELEGTSLTQRFEVINSGMYELGFQLGGHPAFAVPFRADASFSDYKVHFDREMNLDRHLLTKDGLYSGETRKFLNNESDFALFYDLFKEDALVFKEIPSKRVWIQHTEGGKKLQMDYEGFPHLGIWSIPGADYVCLEPWIGCADMVNQPSDFFEKDKIIRLIPGQNYKANFKIELFD